MWGRLLVTNAINRYPINSSRLPELQKNDDGSLTLDIRKDASGLDKESDWLPEPGGPIYIVLCLLSPKEMPPSILPPGAGTWKALRLKLLL